MVAAKIANLGQGSRTDLQPSVNSQKVSQPEAAELLNVSTWTVSKAKKVLDEGAPALVEKVEQGAVAVSTAAEIAALPLFDALDTERQRPLKRREAGGFPEHERSAQLSYPLRPGHLGKDPCRILHARALLLPIAPSESSAYKCCPRAPFRLY